MGIKYIVSTRSVSEDFNLAYETIRKNGFDIEIASEHLDDYITTNVEPYSVHLPYDKIYLTHPDDKIRKESAQRIIEELKKAHLKKVKLAVLHIEGGYNSSPKIPIEDKVSYFKMAASDILECADKFGIKIALENNGYIKDSFAKPEEILMVVEDLAKKYTNVGICFDTGHANVYAHDSGQDLITVFEKLRKYIIYVHIHENHGEEDEHLPPQGIFNNAFYRSLLSLHNASFTFETKGPSGIGGIMKAKKFIEEIIKKKEIDHD
ncbi:MAG: sugar phosphate isomerase/epimerase [Desulfobacterales bacterium]|nr:sugar phosphate isomerase/epimerase [Desulfobacterales bacterium]